jgi:hypothetical protein
MNFDTRTILDLINLDDLLRNNIVSILDEETELSKKKKTTNKPNDLTIDFASYVINVKPAIKDCLRLFLKKDLKRLGLPILKGVVNINNISYEDIVDNVRNSK